MPRYYVQHERIHEDMRYLAGQLLHRGALTEQERQAAVYIRDRFRSYTPDVEMDEFKAIENPFYLFASYYAEFLVVTIIAVWWPRVGLCYGACVFLAYIAEFMGFPLFSRFLPHFQSQNVIARFLAAEPRSLFVVTAHYDSGRASPVSRPAITLWLRPLHLAVIVSMLAILATCAIQALGVFADAAIPMHLAVRWGAVGLLLSAAAALFHTSMSGEEIRGANCNASGVAALLRLAERYAAEPPDTADVWLVATGGHESWMAGMRHLLTSHSLDKSRVFILNIEGVGAGGLHYLTEEGMLRMGPSAQPMIEAAGNVRDAFDARPGTLRAVPSAAHMAIARGYQAMTVMGLDETGLPPHWNWLTDVLTAVDDAAIANASDFCEALLRRLERQLA
ncbi:MAG: M28 family peptidase [Candidatus Hydrogenedentes bacterium]|nr:M28 family peptidase [Candidatus Hydrogenedentota bacterium]